MRTAGIWMALILGGGVLTGAALAQVPDDEGLGVTPASAEDAAVAQSDEVKSGTNYQAPGVHVWMGRVPSVAEFQTARTTAPSEAKRRKPSVSDAPDFQNGHIQVYLGRVGTPGGR